MDTEEKRIGDRMLAFFDIPAKNGRVDTTWGDKTPTGIGACVLRIVKEEQSREPDPQQ